MSKKIKFFTFILALALLSACVPEELTEQELQATLTAMANKSDPEVEAESTAIPSTTEADEDETENPLWEQCTDANYNTAAVKKLVHPGVVRLSTEACTWTLSMSKTDETTEFSLPTNAVVTVHRPDHDNAEVFKGSIPSVELWGGATIRFKPGFDEADDMTLEEWACMIWEKENENGLAQTNPFIVEQGNISCSGTFSVPASSSNDAEVSCPAFGGYSTTTLADGGCKFPWIESRGVVTAPVPEGFRALYWDGSATQNAKAGETIKTGEATFYSQ